MSDHINILRQTVDRLFQDLAELEAQGDGGPATQTELWQRIEELGIADLLLPEEEGGMDADWVDAALLFRLCGYHALSLPVGETIIGRKILHEAGLGKHVGPLAFGHSTDGTLSSGRLGVPAFTGTVATNSITMAVGHIVVSRQSENDYLLLSPADAHHARVRTNVAGEARHTYDFDLAPATVLSVVSSWPCDLTVLGALLRANQSAGALNACLDLCVSYTRERKQFGRPLQKFQAIQHQIAQLAEEAAATMSGAAAAALALDRGEASFEVACAKLRANQAVGIGTSIAHQVHGAIGFTREYGLHRHTQQLWAWRSEFGNDRYWARFLGRIMLSPDKANPWAMITQRGEMV